VSAASPAADGPGWPTDAVEVGRIVDAWGVKGWIKVQPFAAQPQALFSSRRWFLKPSEDVGIRRLPGAGPPQPALLRVIQAKEHGNVVVAQIHDVTDRGSAEALRGMRIFVGRSSFPTAGDDEYYWVDLIGLAVVNRQGELLGSVAGLIDAGPHSVLRVAPDGTRSTVPAEEAERLIPFVAAYVDDVDMGARCITVDWGLDF
jgi:16S rRNA processing protein RimM